METEFDIDGTGVLAPSLAEALESTNEQMRGIAGANVVLTVQTPQGQIARLTALTKVEFGEVLVQALTAVDPDHAEDAQLRTLGGLLQIMAVLATRSRVTATLTGVDGTNVPAMSRAQTADRDAFRTMTDVTLSATGVTVEMESVDEGDIPAPAGTLTRIVTAVPGWETITNANAAVLGMPAQTDDAFRQSMFTRTSRLTIGSIPAMEAGLEEAGAERTQVEENRTTATVTVQEWTIHAGAVLVIAESGTDGDITRAVETYRAMGTPTMTAISGGTADESALDAINNGTVSWDGTDYTGLDLTGSLTSVQKAAALTTLLDGTGVTVSYVDGRYLAQFEWVPTNEPMFGTGAVEPDFALSPATATYPAGPFARPRTRNLAVTMTVTRQPGFPADGLNQIRTAVTNVVNAYGLGATVWANDILAAVEDVGGTRVSPLTVQYDNADISGVVPPLDTIWALPAANLSITIT